MGIELYHFQIFPGQLGESAGQYCGIIILGQEETNNY